MMSVRWNRSAKVRQPGRLVLLSALCALILPAVDCVGARAAGGSGDVPTGSAPALGEKMVAVENAESIRKGRYSYLSNERSERTGGRLWTERVVETSAGKVRKLIAEDGQPLTGDIAAAESAKLTAIAADPDGFQRRSQALKDDEIHAKLMLGLLPKAFLLDGMRMEGEFVRIDIKPNPGYTPQSLEERVLHGMVGSMLVDAKSFRLHKLEGRLSVDVAIGFGLLATIKAGSNFLTTREPVTGDEWKTAILKTDINGHAIFFKAIGKKEDAVHTEFVPVPKETTVTQAVAMLAR